MAKSGQPTRPTRSPNGGFTAWTATRQTKIVESIRRGVYLEVAARTGGVDVNTLRRWMQQGEDRVEVVDGVETVVEAPEPFRGFRVAVLEAEALLEDEATNTAYVAAQAQANSAQGPSPHGMLQFMSRRFRSRWAEKASVEVSGPEGGPVKVEGGDDLAGRLAGVIAGLARAGVVALPGDAVGDAGEPDPEAAD